MKSRQFFDLISNIFDYLKRRVTDLVENTKVYLPKLGDVRAESEIEMIRDIIMSTYKDKKDELNNKLNSKNDKDADKNQEWSNLTNEEKKGLRNLKKTLAYREIVLVKTDKSGKMAVMDKGKYLSISNKSNSINRSLNRAEVKREKRDKIITDMQDNKCW